MSPHDVAKCDYTPLDLAVIEMAIALLDVRLPTIKGRATEVWSRIIGYYGNIAPGKRMAGRAQEIDERTMFDVEKFLNKRLKVPA